MSPYRPIINLDVKVKANKEWKLTWRDPKAYWPDLCYHVDSDLVKEVASDVRMALQTVVDEAMGKKHFSHALKQLARKGSELKDAIFTGEKGEDETTNDIRQTFLPERTDCMIMVNADKRVYIPWGLIYDGDADSLPDDAEDVPMQQYRGFWCVRYLLSTLYDGVNARAVEKPRNFSDVQMLSVVNLNCWTPAVEELDDEEKSIFARVWDLRGKRVTSSKKFFQEWKARHTDLDLLYFYCHANGSMLSFGGEDFISMKQFRLRVRHDTGYPICLVFLNGCQTAVGEETGGFMEATGRLGFCGFIGTEAKVPDLFALRFATDFFCHLLYDGQAVVEILEGLREEHWPLSLVYCMSCHPLFRITRDAAAGSPAKPKRNLSHGKVFVKQTL